MTPNPGGSTDAALPLACALTGNLNIKNNKLLQGNYGVPAFFPSMVYVNSGKHV